MPRQTRDDFPGAWHHVFHRGARKAPIFRHHQDCYGFLEYLAKTVDRFCLEVHAYSLMPNHYHLLVRTPLGNLSRAMQFLNGSYTLWLNKKHNWDGPVFRGRFGSQLVESDDYLEVLVAYIHLNPVEAHLVSDLSDEAWTSFRAYSGKDPAPAWLSTETLLRWFGGIDNMRDYILSYHRGSRRYPVEFEKDAGIFRTKLVEEKREVSPFLLAKAVRPARKESDRTGKQLEALRWRSPQQVIVEVTRMTGATLEDLKENKRGPGANSARRFAIWALDRCSELSQMEIGHFLGVPYGQVSNTLSRLRKQTKEPISGWIEAWMVLEEARSKV